MSAPGIILPLSWADGRSITASSQASGALAAENLLDEQPSIPWRSDGAGTHILSGSFGATRRCTAGVLWNHNLAAGDTVTWELANDAAFSADLVSNQLPGRFAMYESDGPVGGDSDGGYKAPFVVAVISEVERTHWRWTIERASAYSQVGRMMIGLGWQPPINFDWGLDISWGDPSIVTRTRGGQSRALLNPKFRAGSIRWSWLDTDGAAEFDDITYVCGKGRIVLIIPYPDDLDQPWARRKTVLARIVDHTGPREEEHGYTASTQIEEVL